ncbi:hypothetical protein ACVWWI_006251 [Bradyrhizobium sp. USDA 3686]|nr:hypothetical protein [Bradyrhizobium canariense]
MKELAWTPEKVREPRILIPSKSNGRSAIRTEISAVGRTAPHRLRKSEELHRSIAKCAIFTAFGRVTYGGII